MHSSNNTEQYRKNCVISHAQNTTALQPNVILTRIYRLLVKSKRWSTCPKANNWQGQMLTPQSILVFIFYVVEVSTLQRILSWFRLLNTHKSVKLRFQLDEKYFHFIACENSFFSYSTVPDDDVL
jgi:hypothetical protein